MKKIFSLKNKKIFLLKKIIIFTFILSFILNINQVSISKEFEGSIIYISNSGFGNFYHNPGGYRQSKVW